MRHFLIALDQLINTITWIKGDGFGYPDESLSARAWRQQDDSRYWYCLRLLIDGLFCLQDGHCYQAYVSEVENKQLPTHYQKLGDDNAK